ncbi:MAG: Fic family protein [Chitinispirillales bacterium]|jgi:Fic family protein|nr:Fic family protein [Chitinispirillales bacterium]
MKYIHESPRYPNFTWDCDQVMNSLAQVSVAQGLVLGKMQQFGFGIQQEAVLNAMAEEITKSSEIEGEILNSDQVRSSLARKLNIDLDKEVEPSRHIDGIVTAVMDAVNNYDKPLTRERLFGWHAALFPTGYSGPEKIIVAAYRDDRMRIISNKGYREVVHYEAPLPEKVHGQMHAFLRWLNRNGPENPLIKAAVAHLWFVIIHPFDDGNGRLTRVITEMLLARAEKTPLRFYSMSTQIQKEKKRYYAVLEQTTTGGLDITGWLCWFLECLERAIAGSEEIIGKVLRKAEFWHKYASENFSPVQREIINRLFDGFVGNLTSGKVCKIFKVSLPTATRMLQDLTKRELLEMCGAGRSTHYVLAGDQSSGRLSSIK